MINPAITINDLQKMNIGNMCEHVGIEYMEVGEDYIVAKILEAHTRDEESAAL